MVQTIPADSFATVILTRPRAASEAFKADLEPSLAGVSILMSPLLEIVPTDYSVDLTGYFGVIFTSTNGVLHGGPPSDVPAFCVGNATTELAVQHGWNAQTLGETSQDLIAALKDLRPQVPLLHIGGRHRRGDVATHLARSGISTDTIDVYDQRLKPLSNEAKLVLRGEKPVIVPLFSPRTAGQFAAEADIKAPVHFVAISDSVLAEVATLPYVSQHVSSAPDAKSVSETLRNVLRRVEADDAAQ